MLNMRMSVFDVCEAGLAKIRGARSVKDAYHETPIACCLLCYHFATALPSRHFTLHIRPRDLLPRPTGDVHFDAILILTFCCL
jgi:hypothetical protein